MERTEARERIEAAVSVLIAHGYTNHECNRMIDGLYRDDAVEYIERTARHAQIRTECERPVPFGC